ncbi:MAG: efflux RND transporter periplasmic adaptor subunit [Candidatus Riflebacteria bacterium]|nr:efflux RND transporter periplasmic adaptor subunit [Candidatus Riflebacteria bacterium]
MKQSFKLFVICFCIFALLGIAISYGGSGDNSSIHDTAGDNLSMSGNGVIEATEVEISTKVTARVATLSIRVGDLVASGQTIALLESEDFLGQVDQAKAQVKLAEAHLEELVNGTRPEEIQRARSQYFAAQQSLHQAQARCSLVHEGPRTEQIAQLKANLAQEQATLDDAERELTRSKRLEREGAAPGQQADQAKTHYDVAKARVASAMQRLVEAKAGSRGQERADAEAAVDFAKAQVEAASATLDLALLGPRREVVDASRAQLDLARAQFRTAQAMLDFTHISSPLTGRVTERNLEPGELVTPGTPIVQIADLETLWMKVYIPATQVGLVKYGQTANVICDSLPDKVFPGRVVEISQYPEFTPKNVQTRDERIKQIFWVKIEMPNSTGDLKPGMPGEATIKITGLPSPK